MAFILALHYIDDKQLLLHHATETLNSSSHNERFSLVRLPELKRRKRWKIELSLLYDSDGGDIIQTLILISIPGV